MHRILIIGEAALTAKKLWKRIANIEPELSLMEIKDNLENAVLWLQENRPPDLIISDILLPDSLGFDILNRTGISAPVVFVTPHDPYIINLFKKHGIHFIEKPIKKTALKSILSKLKEGSLPSQKSQINKALELYKPPQPVFKKRFVVKQGLNSNTVVAESIAYFFTQEKNNYLVTLDNVEFEIDYNLDALETLLDPKLFLRINRQFIISIKSVVESNAYSKSRLKLKLRPFCKTDTIVSAARVSDYKKWIKK